MNDPINPGEGWRILRIGEMTAAGDEVLLPTHHSAGWHPSAYIYEVTEQVIRRRIEKTQEQKDIDAYRQWYSAQTQERSCYDSWFAALAYARKEAK